MTPQEKQTIVDALRAYCTRVGGQNKAARTLKNVSGSTVSNMLTGKHELITVEMWRSVAKQIGLTSKDWQIVPTSVYNELNKLLKDAQSDNGVSAIIGTAGCGKSETSKRYVADNKCAYRLECSEFWNRKTFMLELLLVMGVDSSGFTVNEMMQKVIQTLKSQENPIIILDEADKLSDQVLYFFITLYNKLEDHCAIILLATAYLEKRITRGVALNKKGYNEIFSRIGRKCIALDGNTYEDIAAICSLNGVNTPNSIEKIINDSDSDLRRVKKLARANIKKCRESGK